MDPIKKLADELDRDRAEREARMTPEEKRQSDEYLDGLAERITLNGIRAQFPGAAEERVRAILAERRETIRRLEARRDH